MHFLNGLSSATKLHLMGERKRLAQAITLTSAAASTAATSAVLVAVAPVVAADVAAVVAAVVATVVAVASFSYY